MKSVGMLWYMVYTVLFAVPEHVHDHHCCSNHFSVLFLVFWLISLGLVFVFPMLCDCGRLMKSEIFTTLLLGHLSMLFSLEFSVLVKILFL
jgi:hypothetical protein